MSLTEFKNLDFKAHPQAPCLVLLYDSQPRSTKQQLCGAIVIETDDFLGGGVGPKWDKAIAAFRKRFDFGKWKMLQDAPLEFGGRTIRQLPDFGFEISMGRYLRQRGQCTF